MKNHERIRQMDIANLALSIICPYDMGLMDKKKCGIEIIHMNGKCGSCCYEWLQEEEE